MEHTTARYYREVAEGVNRKKAEELVDATMPKILKKVEDKANSGGCVVNIKEDVLPELFDFSLSCHQDFENILLGKLKDLGFKVNICYDSNEVVYNELTISWKA